MKNPVYGWEQPYLEQIKKEILIYTDQTFFDGFSNLIAEKKGDKKILVGFCASENALLVNEIFPDGTVGYCPLWETADTFSNERVLSPAGRQGLINHKEKKLDFGTSDVKATARIVKKGDVVYVKPLCETLGDSYITNEIPYFFKQIFVDFIKKTNTKVSVAFLRETKKGAHALGIHYPAEEAYFVTCMEELPAEVCFLKKEGDFISSAELPTLPTAVSKEMKTPANTYFLSGGCTHTAGIALKATKLPNGHYKIKKSAVEQLFAFLKTRATDGASL
ncbi:MAG: hypothetical protein J6A61_09160 [Clostridia bacterium]|nr:hypothetical protein [Clostridia bacterium]